MKLYKQIAGTIQARLNCMESDEQNKKNNPSAFKPNEWISKHEDKIDELIKLLPHGSGIDGTNSIDLDKSNGEKVIINISFHHMDDNGFYDGWTDHKIIMTPSLISDFDLKITGVNLRDIKTYLADMFYQALDEDIKK